MNTNLQELDAVLKQLNSTTMGRRAFIASVPLLLAACASTEKTRYREGDNTGQASALTVNEEKNMTAKVLPEMKKDYPALKDPRMQSYIKSLGNKIVTTNGLSGKPYNYSFTVVDVPNVNAFALPAGTVFVTAPLIAMAETEAELAGVVGHEVGHVVARHSAERMFKAQKEQSKSWMYALGGGLIGGVLGYGIGKIACKPKDKACLEKAAKLGAATGAGGGLLIQKYYFMANSREDEMEADRIGFKTAYRAGFDKDYVGAFYNKLLEMEKRHQKGQKTKLLSSVQDAMSTHPPSTERVVQMKQMSSQASARPRAIVTSDEFKAIKALAQRHTKSS